MPKQKIPYAEAKALADALAANLAPFVERIEIVGSLRRLKHEVSDVEVLFIPRLETRPVDMFATKAVDLADEELNRWLASGVLEKRLNVIGNPSAWGPKNKLTVHAETGVACDFFATTAENWWTSLVIRTGSLSFNLKLTTGAIARRRSLHAYGNGYTTFEGEKIACASEREVCEYAGVPYAEPWERE